MGSHLSLMSDDSQDELKMGENVRKLVRNFFGIHCRGSHTAGLCAKSSDTARISSEVVGEHVKPAIKDYRF